MEHRSLRQNSQMILTMQLWCEKSRLQPRQVHGSVICRQHMEMLLERLWSTVCLIIFNTSIKLWSLVRPVINSNSSLRVDEKEGSRTRFDVSGLTIVRGEKAELKCPVYGDPKPEIIWRLANDRQILVTYNILCKHVFYSFIGLWRNTHTQQCWWSKWWWAYFASFLNEE